MSNNFVSFNDFKNKTSNKPFEQEVKTPTVQIVPKEVKEVTLEVQNTQNSPVANPITVDTVDLENKIKKAKRQNGLIEKVADKIKGLVGFGSSSKKLDVTLQKAKMGEMTSEQAQKEVEIYRSSQENVAQAVGDVASCGASLGVFFAAKQGVEKLVAKHIKINNSKDNVADYLEDLADNSKGNWKKLFNFAKNFADKHLDKRYTAVIAGAACAAFVGGLVKWLLLKINRIGTKQYKADIDKQTMSKKEIKQAKKQAKKARKNANFRNFMSGAINGLATPVVSVLGVAGAPIYVAINSISRYFVASKENAGKKSIKGYVENLKQNPVSNIAAAAAIAIPAIQKGKFNKVFEKNIDTVVENLQKAQLTQDLGRGKTSYQQLEEVLFGNEKIKNIMENENLSISQKIQQLSDENLFAVKFKQINSNSDELARALKTDCPPTRTIEEAQALIDETFGKKYKVQKCVGVGTVAETYLVKEGDSEYCIKMLKNGITAQKITEDRDKFVAIIDALTDKTPQEKQFLKDNIENIYQGVLKEVDFNNEMQAAQDLAKVTTKAKLVQPVEVKNGLYVMQKAGGVSLSDFVNYATYKSGFTDDVTGKIKPREEYVKEVQERQELLNSPMEQMKRLKARLAEYEAKNYVEGIKSTKVLIDSTQDNLDGIKELVKHAEEELKRYDRFIELEQLKIGELSEEEAKTMLESYQDILVEQFSEVSKDGKIIHADIHPGNIFIDIDGLKAGRKDFFTLIDTGNTIQQDQQMAMRFLNLSHYIKNADYENIADFVLEGATLPKGMEKSAARDKLVEELKKAFFDNETHTGKITNDNILSLTDGVMQKLGIIPSDTQGNLMKAKTSANGSMIEFAKAYGEALERQLEKKYENITDRKDINIAEVMADGMKTAGKLGKTTLRFPMKQQAQERKNLALLSAVDKAKLKQSKSAPKKNSVEFLTYELKQNKKTAQQIVKDIQDKIKNYKWNAETLCRDLLEQNGKPRTETYGMELPELIKDLKPEQRGEVAKKLEKAQKYANRLPDGEEKTKALKEIQDLLNQLK